MSPRDAVQLVAGLLPASRPKNVLLSAIGHDVDASASIAPILLLPGARIEVGAGARIGPFNAFRAVRVHVGAAAEVGQLNWVSAAPFLVEESTSASAGELHLGDHASLTSRHYIDASGGVSIGAYTTVAGVRSTFMTHGIDVTDGLLDTAPIVIGDRAMVGSNCHLVYGAVVPARSVVAMGSVVIPGLLEEDTLYAGTPARGKKRVSGTYFRRSIGKVAVRPRGARAMSEAAQS
jgi:acetyltransferase-like isoleucine patch superfamily enzyme